MLAPDAATQKPEVIARGHSGRSGDVEALAEVLGLHAVYLNFHSMTFLEGCVFRMKAGDIAVGSTVFLRDEDLRANGRSRPDLRLTFMLMLDLWKGGVHFVAGGQTFKADVDPQQEYASVLSVLAVLCQVMAGKTATEFLAGVASAKGGARG